MSFEALHALALRRKADLESLSKSSDLEPQNLASELAEEVAAGRVIQARGLYVLAPAGAAWLQERYPIDFAEFRNNPALISGYEDFESINRELKSLITQWQTIEIGGQSIPNDHSNSAHDDRILDRLARLHESAVANIGLMAVQARRLAHYSERLGEALERAEAGEIEWVSSIRIDSYHTVWFEMHEDLLRMLGRTREE